MTRKCVREVFVNSIGKGLLVSYARKIGSYGAIMSTDPLLLSTQVSPSELGHGIISSLDIDPKPVSEEEFRAIREGSILRIPRNRPDVVIKLPKTSPCISIGLLDDETILVRVWPKTSAKIDKEYQRRGLELPSDTFPYQISDAETVGRDCLKWLEKAKNWPHPFDIHEAG